MSVSKTITAVDFAVCTQFWIDLYFDLFSNSRWMYSVILQFKYYTTKDQKCLKQIAVKVLKIERIIARSVLLAVRTGFPWTSRRWPKVPTKFLTLVFFNDIASYFRFQPWRTKSNALTSNTYKCIAEKLALWLSSMVTVLLKLET